VGQNVPFTTGQTQNAVTGSASIFNTVERKDVGIKLSITPQISSDDTVRLDVNQEISDVVQASFLNPTGLVTNKRSAITTVVVRDRETMVIGGLIRDNVTTSEDKVPFLGDIPLIGWLFKFKSTKVEKVNLILFITPYIIKNEEDAQYITNRKAEALEKFRDEYHIEKKSMGGLIESRKPAPPGTTIQPDGKAGSPGVSEAVSPLPASRPGAEPSIPATAPTSTGALTEDRQQRSPAPPEGPR